MAEQIDMGVRRFGAINWVGLRTLGMREVRRFMNVWSQTVMAPLINAGLLLMIFTIAIGPGRGDVMGVSFMTFLAPGILTMTVIQNAFANTSSSLASAKVGGNIVDTLMPPLSATELLCGYLFGALVRGWLVASVIALGAWMFLGVGLTHWGWFLTFVTLGSLMMGGLGMIAGIFANKFDQLSAIQNFLVTPLAFLSGTFYSIEALPPLMQQLSHANPFFYVIDGVRFGMIGVSDSSPWLGLLVVLAAIVVVLAIVWRWLAQGFRLKP
ncbi:ABC transporter permease [Yoonia sp. R2331]|uniref:ABC transporter permease n=1 Tax=Yoonia sp. R2331 TaxID=3237238 RepID=UPI0034E38EA5